MKKRQNSLRFLLPLIAIMFIQTTVNAQIVTMWDAYDVPTGAKVPVQGKTTETRTNGQTSIEFDNGFGSKSASTMSGSTITVTKWGITGTISADRKRIDWSDKTYWVQSTIAKATAPATTVPAAAPSTTAPANAAAVHFIGEKFGGGTVFYVYDNGRHGLVASALFKVALPWASAALQTTQTKAFAKKGVGAGKINTYLIYASEKGTDPKGSAAVFCVRFNDYMGLDFDYAEWYLPSSGELGLMYAQKALLGMAVGEVYWSSTEDATNPSNATVVAFGEAKQFEIIMGKNVLHLTRPIRAFCRRITD